MRPYLQEETGITMVRWGAGLAVVALVVVTLAVPAPAYAAGEIAFQNSYVCTIVAGQRSGNLLALTQVSDAGTVTAISADQPVTFISPVGSAFAPDKTASAQFNLAPGPTSITFTLSVHWDNLRGNGPADVTQSSTMQLNSCQTDPITSLVSQCDGTVKVNMANGPDNQTDLAGGSVDFEIDGAFGYHIGPFSVDLDDPGFEIVPAAAASDITVFADGKSLARGHYVAQPGCAGYVPPAVGGGSSGGSGGSGGGSSGGSSVVQPVAGSPIVAPTASGPPSMSATASASPAEPALAAAVSTSLSVGPILLSVVTGALAGIGGVLLIAWRRRTGTGAQR